MKYHEATYFPVAAACEHSPVVHNLSQDRLWFPRACPCWFPVGVSLPVEKNPPLMVSTAVESVSVNFPPVGRQVELPFLAQVAGSRADDRLFVPSLQTDQQRGLDQ